MKNEQKCLVLRSNQGNHSGVNREWFIEAKCYDRLSAVQEMHQLADYVAEKHNLDEEERDELYDGSEDTFEYDLTYYYIVGEDDYYRGFFDSRHGGNATDEIINFFEENQ